MIEQAERLALDQRRKIDCTVCHGKKSVMISRSVRGANVYCFKCDHREYKSVKPSLKDYVASKEAVEELKKQEPDTISITNPDVPSYVRNWLTSHWLTLSKAEDHGIRFAPKSRRVLLPVHNHVSETGEYQLRGLAGAKPKYISSTGCKEQAWFKIRSGEPIVVVEDILSAIRVYEAGFSSVAILGTGEVPTRVYKHLLDSPAVLSWFDNDHAGDKARKKLYRSVMPFGIRVKHIRTLDDPKTYHQTPIRRFIQEGLR